MDNLVQLITSCFVNSIWEVAAVGGAGWVVSRLLKWFSPRVQHLLWMTTLALATITPVLPLLRSMLAKIGFRPIVQNHFLMMPVTMPGGQPLASTGLILPPALVLTLFFLFLGMLVCFATRLSWLLYYTIRLRQEAYPVSLGPEAEELWSHCKQAFSLKEAQVLRSEKIAGPVTIGFTRPALLVSQEFIKGCRSQDFLAALAHECAHMKRRDFEKNLLYEITSLVIAYHPVTWFVKSQIAQTREMICDDMATERLIDPDSYAESLLRLAKMISLSAGTLTSNAIGIFDANVLEERIMMIKTKKRHFRSRVKYAVTTASALLLFSVAAVIGALARPIQAQSQGASSAWQSAKKASHVDLSCTYYTQDAQNRAFEGTCETHKGDKAHYYCGVIIGGQKLSEEQAGCEWKIQRAKSQKVEGFAQ